MAEETKEANVAETGSGEMVEVEEVSETAVAEAPEGSPAAQVGDDAEEKAESERAKNARFAQQRREKEAQAKAQAEREAEEKRIKEEAYLQGRMAQAGVNPYNNKPIKTADDLQLYELMKKADSEGKEPISNGYEAFYEAKAQEAEKAKAEADERAKKEQAEAKAKADRETDIAEAKKAYPDLDFAELSKNPRWLRFSKGKFATMPLKEIISDYLEDEKEAEADRKKASPAKSAPSSTKGGTAATKSWKDMTADEYVEYCKRTRGHF